MTPEQVLLLTMVENEMKINPGTLDSLREAIESNNIYFFDKDGEASGFVTWFMDGDDLEINNLCLFESGIHKLYELRDFFHRKYPSLSKVKWWDHKHNREVNYVVGKNENNPRPVSVAENSGS